MSFIPFQPAAIAPLVGGKIVDLIKATNPAVAPQGSALFQTALLIQAATRSLIPMADRAKIFIPPDDPTWLKTAQANSRAVLESKQLATTEQRDQAIADLQLAAERLKALGFQQTSEDVTRYSVASKLYPGKSISGFTETASQVAKTIVDTIAATNPSASNGRELFLTALLIQAAARALSQVEGRDKFFFPQNDPPWLIEAQKRSLAILASGVESTLEQRSLAVRDLNLAAEQLQALGYHQAGQSVAHYAFGAIRAQFTNIAQLATRTITPKPRDWAAIYAAAAAQPDIAPTEPRPNFGFTKPAAPQAITTATLSSSAETITKRKRAPLVSGSRVSAIAKNKPGKRVDLKPAKKPKAVRIKRNASRPRTNRPETASRRRTHG